MFHDRKDAGKRLAERLRAYKNAPGVFVLALPRGGVVTGYEIARALLVPLDVLIVQKIGFPGEAELAIGAIAETGAVVLNKNIIAFQRVSNDYLEAEIARQKKEIARRTEVYRRGRAIRPIEGRTVILVDDGVATGATIKAGIAALLREKPAKLIIALPVAPPETAGKLKTMVDDFICLETPADFTAVGVHYINFDQVTDQEVIELLQQSIAQTAEKENLDLLK